MADKSIKVKIGADSKEFNASVTKAEKEVRTFSSQLRTTDEESAKKAIGTRSYIDAIYKGLVSWGQVILLMCHGQRVLLCLKACQ